MCPFVFSYCTLVAAYLCQLVFFLLIPVFGTWLQISLLSSRSNALCYDYLTLCTLCFMRCYLQQLVCLFLAKGTNCKVIWPRAFNLKAENLNPRCPIVVSFCIHRFNCIRILVVCIITATSSGPMHHLALYLLTPESVESRE